MTCQRAFRAVSHRVWRKCCWPDDKPIPAELPAQEELPTQQEVMEATVPALKKWLKAAQLKVSGSKAELQDRLLAALAEGPKARSRLPVWIQKLVGARGGAGRGAQRGREGPQKPRVPPQPPQPPSVGFNPPPLKPGPPTVHAPARAAQPPHHPDRGHEDLPPRPQRHGAARPGSYSIQPFLR
jgi:hypothetical protein